MFYNRKSFILLPFQKKEILQEQRICILRPRYHSLDFFQIEYILLKIKRKFLKSVTAFFID